MTKTNGKAGFTLVELLVVILIIMCLVAVLVPTIAGVKVMIMNNHSQTTINMIHGAVRQYYEANKYTYPDGNLVAALTASFSGTATNDNSIFRSVKSGGGAYGLDALKLSSTGTTSNSTGYFSDVFGGTIVYADYHTNTDGSHCYRSDTVTCGTTVREIGGTNLSSPSSPTMFTSAIENTSKVLKNRSDLIYGMYVMINSNKNLAVLLGPGTGTSPNDLDHYVRRDNSSDDENKRSYYRRDFILISPGADGAFVDFKDNARSDDLNNFNN